MFQTIQTIYFLWVYDPGNMSVSTCWVEPSLLLSSCHYHHCQQNDNLAQAWSWGGEEQHCLLRKSAISWPEVPNISCETFFTALIAQVFANISKTLKSVILNWQISDVCLLKTSVLQIYNKYFNSNCRASSHSWHSSFFLSDGQTYILPNSLRWMWFLLFALSTDLCGQIFWVFPYQIKSFICITLP